jgi:hypothetical protein
MRRRASLVEHPFGTLKVRAGYRHFLVRGFDKVRGEWSLMALCYNLARVLSIVGQDGFVPTSPSAGPKKRRLGLCKLPQPPSYAAPGPSWASSGGKSAPNALSPGSASRSLREAPFLPSLGARSH